jgi:hypothetical protein
MLAVMKSTFHVLEQPNAPSGTLVPVGVTTERVDPYTLEVIAGLLPSGSGLDFLARLLRLAIVKQLALAGTGQADVAEISVRSIRQLAELIGWSYDTTEKYVRLFGALSLLSKNKQDGLVVLHFALCRYTFPTSLAQLDQLIQARPKVASFAKQVRRRLVRLYGGHLQEMATNELSTSGSAATEIRGIIHDLQQIMALPEAGALQQRLALLEKQLQEIDGRLGAKMVDSPAEGSHENGRFVPEMVDSAASASAENGRLGAKMVDSPAEGSHENGRFVPEMVDSAASASAENGRLGAKMVDSPAEGSHQNGRLVPEMVGSAASAGAENGRLGSETAGSDAKTVDLTGPESPNVNVNIKSVIDQINDNVGATSAYLRERFAESNHGYYHKLQKICNRSEVWLAAAIEVFVAMARQEPPQNPGRYFFSRVCDIHRNGISPAAQDLVQRYGEMSYAQLVNALHAPVSSQGQKTNGEGRGQRPRLGAAVTLELHLERNREVFGMPLEEVEPLRQAIRDEFSGWVSKPYRQADGSCALLVESSLRRQIWLYSRLGWRERLMTLIPQQTKGKD